MLSRARITLETMVVVNERWRQRSAGADQRHPLADGQMAFHKLQRRVFTFQWITIMPMASNVFGWHGWFNKQW
jgi:hypothetical protein